MSFANLIIYGDRQQLAEQVKLCSDLDTIDEYGYTPLIQAAIVDDVEKARLILQQGANANMADLTGRTALHWAVDNTNLPLCELLLEHNADPNAYTLASVPVLVKPMLRRETELKELLCQHGADLTFAQDYINSKLLGHRFELMGYVDIVDSKGKFTELSYEGFILEFTLDIIRDSLEQFISNFAARHLESQFGFLHNVIDGLQAAKELIKLQHYLVDIGTCVSQVNKILRQDPIIIPLVQEGHAISLVRYKNLLALCDRSQKKDPSQRTVTIYYMNRPSRLQYDLLKKVMYSRQSLEGVQKHLIKELAMQPVSYLSVPEQLMGNCSWANIEICMPTLMVMMALNQASSQSEMKHHEKIAMGIYKDWQHWDKERALHFCFQSLSNASPARKAAKLTILAAVLFQCCLVDNPRDLRIAEKIIPLLKTDGYEYLLQSYLKVYTQIKRSELGDNLKKLLSYGGDEMGEFEQVG